MVYTLVVVFNSLATDFLNKSAQRVFFLQQAQPNEFKFQVLIIVVEFVNITCSREALVYI